MSSASSGQFDAPAPTPGGDTGCGSPLVGLAPTPGGDTGRGAPLVGLAPTSGGDTGSGNSILGRGLLRQEQEGGGLADEVPATPRPTLVGGSGDALVSSRTRSASARRVDSGEGLVSSRTRKSLAREHSPPKDAPPVLSTYKQIPHGLQLDETSFVDLKVAGKGCHIQLLVSGKPMWFGGKKELFKYPGVTENLKRKIDEEEAAKRVLLEGCWFNTKASWTHQQLTHRRSV